MTENPYPLSGVLQVGDLRVGPYMWLEACARADRAEFLLALIFAANDPRLTTKEGSRWVRADRRDEAEDRAQAAEVTLSRVVGVLEPFLAVTEVMDRGDDPWPDNASALRPSFAFPVVEGDDIICVKHFRGLARLHAELTGGAGQ
jgi:hypothetical protein